ncbi:MAG: TIGR02594 family protein [Bacteroidota bacterium]
MKALPSKFQWLDRIPVDTLPKLWVEARKHYGVLETPGPVNTPEIMKWAKEVNASGYYGADLIPWCGLFMAVIIKRSGYKVVIDPLASKNWAMFGTMVLRGLEMFCDVLTFVRPGGNHVGLYIAESATEFLVWGGNTANAVGLAWIAKDRLIHAGRCPWAIGQPAAVKKYLMNRDSVDLLSINEA